MYKLIKNPFSGQIDTIVRLSDMACIPFAPDNTDYQKYLEWLAEGNLPHPADFVEPSQTSVEPLQPDNNQ